MLTDQFDEFNEHHLLTIELIFIVTILLAPRGIVGTLRGHLRTTSEENGP